MDLRSLAFGTIRNQNPRQWFTVFWENLPYSHSLDPGLTFPVHITKGLSIFWEEEKWTLYCLQLIWEFQYLQKLTWLVELVDVLYAPVKYVNIGWGMRANLYKGSSEVSVIGDVR